jgi:hypothetical protein
MTDGQYFGGGILLILFAALLIWRVALLIKGRWWG